MGKKKNSKEHKRKLEKFRRKNKIEKLELSPEQKSFGRLQIGIIVLMVLASIIFVVTQVG